jgi:glycosyltransferase involved in cell wall biosynthesis
MNLKICIVNSFFPPWRGGAETYTYNLAKQLALRGHEIEVLCASPPDKPGRYSVGKVSLARLPVTAWLYGTPIASRLLWMPLKSKMDLIHAGFPSPYNAFSASIASALKGTPSVLTWHNDLPSVTTTARLLVNTHDRLVLPIYIRSFKRIISTSRKYAESSRILKKHDKKVRIVPNGVDCEKFRPDLTPNPIRERLGDTKIILFVGALSRWHSYKGLDVLINAFALASTLRQDMILLVVGDGTLKPAYQRLASQLNVSGKVAFVGDVSDEDLPSYYAASDLLVLPSKDRSEGFGLTILEANACGRPAIGSNVGGVPDVIQHEYNGLLVPPNSPEALSAAIIRLVENDSLRNGMGRNGRRLAEEHDWSRVAEATERVYHEALE